MDTRTFTTDKDGALAAVDHIMWPIFLAMIAISIGTGGALWWLCYDHSSHYLVNLLLTVVMTCAAFMGQFLIFGMTFFESDMVAKRQATNKICIECHKTKFGANNLESAVNNALKKQNDAYAKDRDKKDKALKVYEAKKSLKASLE